MNDKIHTINFEKIFQNIAMSWFYTKPILFKFLCLYELKPEYGIDCDFRTNKKIIEFNPEIIAEKNIKSVKDSLELELCRIMLRHPYRKKPKENEEEWYKASTMTITQSGLVKYNLPEGRNIEFYYAELMKQKKKYEMKSEGGTGNGTGKQNSNIEKESENICEENEGNIQTKESDDLDENADKNMVRCEQPQKEDNTNNPIRLEEKLIPNSPTAHWKEDETGRKAVEDFVKENLCVQLWGELPGKIEEQLKAEFTDFPYYKTLLQYFKDSTGKGDRTLTRMRPNRRCGFLQMGSRYKTLPGRILIALDTSESVSNEELEKFYGAIKSIYLQGIKRIDVIQFDVKLLTEKAEKFSRQTFYKIRGRGGTNYQCVFDYLQRHSLRYGGVIIFTDGYAAEPKIKNKYSLKLMWMLTEKNGAKHWMKKNALCGWF